MTYAETIQYLYDSLPIFQRVGAVAYKADLHNTVELCEALGNPQKKIKTIHVAGTNGKGSSSHLLAAILQCAGYKAGLYTSPHLKEFTERIKINGQEVSQLFVVDFVNRIKPDLIRLKPSFFETTVAMALDYFAAEQVHLAVIEVGLGGRLDSTNIITPLVSLITNIGHDHMNLLGNTLPQIAFEKAGIIKPHVPVVISERQEEVAGVFVNKATESAAPLVFASDAITSEEVSPGTGIYNVHEGNRLLFESLECQLKGNYQRKNIPGVLMTVIQLRKLGYSISDEAVRRGMAAVVTLTGLKGRWQRLSEKPLVICDTGHNREGILEVVRQIKSINYRRLHLVLGMVKDKDIADSLTLFPKEATFYFCQAKIPRALPAEELALQAKATGRQGVVVEDVNQALALARSAAQPDDLIFVGGSTFVVAEITKL